MARNCLSLSLFPPPKKRVVEGDLVLSCLALPCIALPCLVLSCLVLSCLVSSCLALSCLVVLFCFVCLVLSCPVLSLFCLILRQHNTTQHSTVLFFRFRLSVRVRVFHSWFPLQITLMDFDWVKFSLLSCLVLFCFVCSLIVLYSSLLSLPLLLPLSLLPFFTLSSWFANELWSQPYFLTKQGIKKRSVF